MFFNVNECATQAAVEHVTANCRPASEARLIMAPLKDSAGRATLARRSSSTEHWWNCKWRSTDRTHHNLIWTPSVMSPSGVGPLFSRGSCTKVNTVRTADLVSGPEPLRKMRKWTQSYLGKLVIETTTSHRESWFTNRWQVSKGGERNWNMQGKKCTQAYRQWGCQRILSREAYPKGTNSNRHSKVEY